MTERTLKPGWKIWRFDQMATNLVERVDPSDTTLDRYVGLEHLDPETLKIRRWGAPTDVIGEKLHFWEGDIIFGKRRAYQRKLAVTDFEGICSAHAMVLRAKPAVVFPGFLPFFMQSDLFMNRAKEISVGSLSPTINWRALAEQEFPLPPLDEQRRIADLLLNIENTRQGLLNLYESIYKLIGSYGKCYWGDKLNCSMPLSLSLHPQNWPRIPLRKLCKKIQDGTHFSPKSNGKDFRYVTSKNIKDGYLDLTDCGWISEEEHSSIYRRCDVKIGDVLLTKDGANTGNVAINTLTEAFSLLSSVAMLRPNLSLLQKEYLYYYLHSRYGRAEVVSQMKGTAITRITLNQLNKLEIPTPDMSDQQIVVGIFNSLYSAKNQLTKRIGSLGKQKKLLLDTLVG